MKIETYKVKQLVASDGHKLTQSADVELAERVVTRFVMLAANSSESDWKEITDAEAEEVLRAQEELRAENDEFTADL